MNGTARHADKIKQRDAPVVMAANGRDERGRKKAGNDKDEIGAILPQIEKIV